LQLQNEIRSNAINETNKFIGGDIIGQSRRADFQGDGERFSFSVAARRQTAANFSALFQMAALCRDAATDGGWPVFGLAEACPANPGARIFKGTVNDSPSQWMAGLVWMWR
jgi:hypothetical protein